MAAASDAQTITPASVTLKPSQTQQFSVAGASKTLYTWSIDPSSGTISTSGLYKAPATITAITTVTVYSFEPGHPALSATVTLMPLVGISVSPTWISMTNGQSAAFTANITGASNTAVTWSGPGVGTITPGGVYTAPMSLNSSQNITLYATSVVDPTKYASATIALVPTIGITLNPTSTSLTSGQSTALNPTVTGTTNTGVNWSLSPQVGTLSNGVYTAPYPITSSETVTVTATSQASTGVIASVTINLLAVSISVSPSSATLTSGQSTTLKATVNGTSNTAVNWTVTPAVGTVTNGVYTAPALVTTAQSVTVKATSAADSTKSASAVISLTPSVSITMTPSTASLTGGQSTTFKATVSGSSNTAVDWSIAPSVGTIASGVYKAPATIASAQTVTVTAASAADPTKTESAKVSLVPVAVTVSPTTASLTGGQSTTLKATVSGSSNASVNWSISPSVGTIAGGVYTAPATIASAQTVTVTATSAADPTKTASATISLVPPAPVAAISVTPSSASLTGGQSVTFTPTVTGSSNTAVNWSLSPAVGTVTNGVYAAPAVISLQQTVTVSAASAADPTKIATASVTLLPSVSVSVSPTSASLTPSQSQQFSVSLSGTTNPNVTWSMSPSVGSLGNGLYQAPATISSQQTVTVTATSLADSTKTGSATITLVPTVGIALTPSSITFTGGQTTQFNVSIAGTSASSTAVTWTLAPSVGTMSNGVYTAPATITSLQTIILTVANIASPTQTATATITLNASTAPAVSVSPSQATLSPSGTQQFTASGITSPTWTISPSTGSISSAGLYTAPSSITTQSTVTATATGTGGSATATITLNPAASTASTGITLPLEVVGPNGTTVSASFTIPSGSTTPAQLWFQIHGLRYATQASVQFNGGAWIPINESTGTVLGRAAQYGGMGGGFHTFPMTMNLPANSITTGTNTITFQFNATDGTVSGFRVLALNILDANGNQLIPQSTFTQTDPNTWQPPSTLASDISAGQTLYTSAPLTVPTSSGPQAIQAHCVDCHTHDGRDLKYFNYSNNSIVSRSMFHGLTTAEGNQIASYIRSLNVPNPGRPWNPPYQPGPGLDSQPVENWAAGAGLSAVLDSDDDILAQLMPGGTATNWAPTDYLNAREIPITLELPDWNHWLPTVHPKDAFGSAFTSSQLYADYLRIASLLSPGGSQAYTNALGYMAEWVSYQSQFLAPLTQSSTSTAWNNPKYTEEIQSVALWQMVKWWDMNQEYGLEGMSQVAFGPQAATRSWFSNAPFVTSPNMLHIPTNAPGVGNGQLITHTYFSHIWYQLQLTLNDGNGKFGGQSPIDFPYSFNFVTSLTQDSPASSQPGNAALLLLWIIKGLQVSNFNQGPQTGSDGWQYWVSDPLNLVAFPNNTLLWSEVPLAQHLAALNAYVNVWVPKLTSFTAQQFIQGALTTANQVPDPASPFGPNMSSHVAFLIPQLIYQGIDPSALKQLATWAKTVWPAYNWAGTLDATCIGSDRTGGGILITCTPGN